MGHELIYSKQGPRLKVQFPLSDWFFSSDFPLPLATVHEPLRRHLVEVIQPEVILFGRAGEYGQSNQAPRVIRPPSLLGSSPFPSCRQRPK